jgi:hypothetical protein
VRQPSPDAYILGPSQLGRVTLRSLTSIGILLRNVGHTRLGIVRRLRDL